MAQQTHGTKRLWLLKRLKQALNVATSLGMFTRNSTHGEQKSAIAELHSMSSAPESSNQLNTNSGSQSPQFPSQPCRQRATRHYTAVNATFRRRVLKAQLLVCAVLAGHAHPGQYLVPELQHLPGVKALPGLSCCRRQRGHWQLKHLRKGASSVTHQLRTEDVLAVSVVLRSLHNLQKQDFLKTSGAW